MRPIALALASLLTLTLGRPASANTIAVEVPVYLSVTPACKIKTPDSTVLKPAITAAVRIPAGIAQSLPQIAVEMLLADCRPGVAPSLTLADGGQSGVYIATIDF